MSNTIRRTILGIQADNTAGEYLAEIKIRQWGEGGEDMQILYLTTLSAPAESIHFFGASSQSRRNEIRSARNADQDIPKALFTETYESMDAAATSAYGDFYAIADRMVQDMKQMYEVEDTSEEEAALNMEDYEIPTDKEEMFRRRLALETDITVDSIFHDNDPDGFEYEKNYVRALTISTESEGEYVTWKKNYIESHFQATKERGIVVCSYIFSGHGIYGMILPQEELHPFQGWLQMSGAMDAGLRDATDEEIRTYIAMQAGRR